MFRDIDKFCVQPADSVRQATRLLDDGQCGIVLVVDEDRRLIGTITDGDIRRALLAQHDIECNVDAFMAIKANPAPPVAVPVGTDPTVLLATMISKAVRQIPLLDENERVVDLVVLQDLLPAKPTALRAVIMAGGRGRRLLPLTEDLPKPMLPVGGRPLLEHIILQLQRSGIRHVNVTTHYKPDKIIEHFADGQAFGVDLKYVNEDQPLGTGGALGLMSRPNETQLVINGDILTQVDFGAMLAFHQDNGAELTVAVRRYEIQVPYGVIDCDGVRVASLSEKPQLGFFVNAGVYMLEPSVYQFIPNGQSFNMTDLIHWLLEAGRTVIGFPIHEYWMDVGRHGDYAQAQDDLLNGRMSR